MTPQFKDNMMRALLFMETHPGGRNRRLTAEEGDGKPWISVAMNFESQQEAEAWAWNHDQYKSIWEREGSLYADAQGYYKGEFPWGLVFAHFPKTL